MVKRRYSSLVFVSVLLLQLGGNRALASESDPNSIEELEPTYFRFDSSVLTKSAQQRLAMQLRYVVERSDITLQIDGHTCPIGTNRYNRWLARRRAEAARDFLVAGGVERSRIRLSWYGEDRPVTLVRSDFVRNRRVELTVIYQRRVSNPDIILSGGPHENSPPVRFEVLNRIDGAAGECRVVVRSDVISCGSAMMRSDGTRQNRTSYYSIDVTDDGRPFFSFSLEGERYLFTSGFRPPSRRTDLPHTELAFFLGREAAGGTIYYDEHPITVSCRPGDEALVQLGSLTFSFASRGGIDQPQMSCGEAGIRRYWRLDIALLPGGAELATRR